MSLPPRDQDAERALLAELKNLDFALLQRDWQDPRHGDLDLVLRPDDWPMFLQILDRFSAQHDFPIVKAYRIDHTAICLVLLTAQGTLFVDVALACAGNAAFGVDLARVLRDKEEANGTPVISARDAAAYAEHKRHFKRSWRQRSTKKIVNMPVIVERIFACTLLCRGGLLYIPYLTDTDLLRSKAVVAKTRDYLLGTLRQRYARQTDVRSTP